MDKATVAGIVLSFGGITTGLLLEGGKLSQILQPTAALIVAGGTIGAVLLQFPLSTVITAVRNLRIVFFEPRSKASDEINRLTTLAQKARRDGIISLDAELPAIADPFMRRALMLAVDGTESSELRAIMQLELDASAEAEEELPRVYEAAGGFAPTIGIIGAVLGLIQVMQHLDKIDEVGRGIAVAFVATIYGVGFANLIALPIAGKLRHRLRFRQILRELTLEGVISILEGINPRMLEAKLTGFLQQATEKHEAGPQRRSRKQEHGARHEEAPETSWQPGALDGLLCRFHDPALRLLRRPLLFIPGRQGQDGKPLQRHHRRILRSSASVQDRVAPASSFPAPRPLPSFILPTPRRAPKPFATSWKPASLRNSTANRLAPRNSRGPRPQPSRGRILR